MFIQSQISRRSIANVPAGATELTIEHGLGEVPEAVELGVLAAKIVVCYASDVTGTHLTINLAEASFSAIPIECTVFGQDPYH